MTLTSPKRPRTSIRRGAARYLHDLWERREFAWYMAMGNLKARNASTGLGLVWWVLNPLLLGAVYYIVFGIIIPVSRDLAYLLSGMFVFYYTSTSLTGGANSILQNARLLINVSFPRLILPVISVVEAGVGYLASIVALYLIIGPIQMLIGKDPVWPTLTTLWLLPIIFVVQTVFNLGLASFAARVAVPFRDVNNIIPYFIRLWLYLSPVIYGPELVDNLSEPWVTIYKVNPLYSILGVSRSALLGYPLSKHELLYAGLWAAGVAMVSVIAFVRYEGRMARYL
jgi:ABC-type polysaccharide/polyol phosphate export permease